MPSSTQMAELIGIGVVCGVPIQKTVNRTPYVLVRIKTLGYSGEPVYFDAVAWGSNYLSKMLPILRTGASVAFRASLCNKKSEKGTMRRRLMFRLLSVDSILRPEEKIPTTDTEASLTILDTIDPYKLLGGDYSELLNEEGSQDE